MGRAKARARRPKYSFIILQRQKMNYAAGGSDGVYARTQP